MYASFPVSAGWVGNNACTKIAGLQQNSGQAPEPWKPEHLKDGRFGNFLTEAKDWALSRNRYWGTPLPVWTCPDEHMVAVGSLEELKQYGGSVPEDLHRPFIDNVKFSCPSCGKEMTREPYVIDTWFDSGSATYAAIHYPMESSRVPLPISFITEAIDQTRGWFYTLHVTVESKSPKLQFSLNGVTAFL